MRTSSALAAAGLVVAAMSGMTGAANAADTTAAGAGGIAPKACYGFFDDPRGTGCFESNGDKIGVEDTKKDGIGVQVHWETDYGRERVCRDTNSGGGQAFCDYDMKEGREVRITLQFTDNGKVVDAIGPSQWMTI